MKRRLAFVVCLTLATVQTRAAGAQLLSLEPTTRSTTGRWIFDFGGQMAAPVGEFRSQVNRAWGVGGSVRRHFQFFEPLGVRLDGAWLNYGNENKTVPLSPAINRVFVDMHTMNNIALITLGPELMVPRGPVRPYVYAFAGYSYFYTESSASDDNGGGSFASSTNFDDGGFASGWGGGVRIPMLFRTVEAALDGGARLTRNGTRTYLRRGDIFDQPDGSLLFNPRTTPVDFWQFHLGLSFAPRYR